MWSSYADCVRGCAREVDTWLRQYQQQDEEDALEIARNLSIQVNDITSYSLSVRKLLIPEILTDVYGYHDSKSPHILASFIGLLNLSK